MRALRCDRPGPITDLTVQELPVPEPGPGEVRVRVTAAALNFPDILLVQGGYQVKIPTPFTVGSEFAGVVDAVGPGGAGVSGVPAVGQQVCGSVMTGAFAEYVVAAGESLVALPDTIDPVAAAGFRVVYDTAFHALHRAAHAQPGEWVVVLGAAGGVGLATVDAAKAHSCRVIAAASSDRKLAACREAGADVVVDYAQADLKSAIKAATGGGADVVIDPVGGDVAEPALRALRSGGRFVTVGFASGAIPSIPLNLVLVKGVSIVGVDLRREQEEDPAGCAAMTRDVFAQFFAGRLHPYVGQRFALDDAVDALGVLARREAIGKVVLQP